MTRTAPWVRSVHGLRAAAAAALAVSAAAAAPSATAAVAVHCGDRLTADTVLTADLRCPDGNGLVLAPGVTLDLGGHRLVGPGPRAEVSSAVSNDAVDESGPGVTVRNGTVEGWPTGVDVTFGGSEIRPHLVEAVAFRRNGTTMALSHGLLRASSVSVTGGSLGVSSFLGSVTVNQSFFTGLATVVSGSNGRQNVEHSTIRDSGVVCETSEDAVCSIRDSRLVGNERINSDWWGGGRFIDNFIAGNSVGIDTRHYGSSYTISGNVFRDNGVAVIGADTPWSVRAVVGNTFVGNSVGYQADGSIDRLENNTFVRNGDAIHITDAAGAALGGNLAVDNTGWGIHATGDVVDLGGNRAARNGNEPQCTGVTCP